MLQSLSIQNIVLVESLHIEFENGLCVLTGETGAGKSIILDSLGLVLGAKNGGKLLRHGKDVGSVTAEFSNQDAKNIRVLLEEFGIEAREGGLLLRRVITKAGRSRAFINDIPVSQPVLATIGEALVEIHGQHDQRGLLNPASHRTVLDAYGRLEGCVADVKKKYQRFKALQQELDALKAKREKAVQEEDYLRYIIGELGKLNPKVGEEEELANSRSRLMNKEKLLGTLQDAIGGLTGDRDMTAQLHDVQRSLMRASGVEEGYFSTIIDILERASIEISEAASSLEHLYDKANNEEANLDQVEERLFALRAAARKFHRTVDELPAYIQDVNEKLALLEGQEETLGTLEQDVVTAKQDYVAAAKLLTEKRKATAKDIAGILIKELTPLKMEATRFEADFAPLEESSWSEHGIDKVQFLVSMNPGMPTAPLSAVASGGELSRFMLALKVVLADIKSVPTMIFDEIDTGIGGAVADAVGKRLGILGANRQVLVVTHQPQVAAYGAYHLKVAKVQKADATFTNIYPLAKQERKEELARMLAGASITEEARAAADKLLA